MTNELGSEEFQKKFHSGFEYASFNTVFFPRFSLKVGIRFVVLGIDSCIDLIITMLVDESEYFMDFPLFSVSFL